MDLQLQSKYIIVTGGAKGIGKGIVHCLAQEGATPIIVGRNERDNIEVCNALIQQGLTCHQVEAELSDPTSINTAIAKIGHITNSIHGLVNNAGVNDGVGLESGNYESFVSSLHKNLIHYYLMAQACLPLLKVSKGSIVNISSKTADTGQGNTSAYAAANGGRNALTREWAVELLPHRIRVNAVVVAECYTPLYENWINTFEDAEGKLKSISNKIPLEKRMTTAHEIAAMVAFLLSPVSSHTTGQLIHVDGGYVHLDRAL